MVLIIHFSYYYYLVINNIMLLWLWWLWPFYVKSLPAYSLSYSFSHSDI